MSEPAKRNGRFSNDPGKLSETDLASDKMGNNKLEGNDQEDVRNQRQAVPDARQEPEGVIESFENADPETRADRERQKGRGAG